MAREDIAERLEGAPLPQDVRRACIILVENLDRIGPGAAKFLPYPMLKDMVGDEFSGASLWSALTYLATFEDAVLNAHGYILNEEGEVLPLEDDEFFQFTLSGNLVHPETGDLIENAKGLVFPYFSVVD
ncbi:hypothetical protein [Ruegeria atlantica]|uniref:hypothetical protein n=1 Tax=Ruegeria atlantica TaxID=81569 RepID=UPI00147A4CAA|nr:hypothetical protein [Ruegeria atlantica]